MLNSLLIIAQGENDTRAIIMIVIATAILIGLIGLFAVLANFFWLWAQSFTTGAGIGLLDLVGMWFRRGRCALDRAFQDYGCASWPG